MMEPYVELAMGALTQGATPSFVMRFYAGLFSFLRFFTPFSLLCRLLRSILATIYHPFVDVWAMGNLALALLTVFITRPSADPSPFVVRVLLLWGAWRVYEIAIIAASSLIFDEYRALRLKLAVPALNYRRLLVHLGHNYIEIILWFASAYMFSAGDYESRGLQLNSIRGALHCSLLTMAAFGDGDVVPVTIRGFLVVTSQTALGMFMTIGVISRWLGAAIGMQRPDSAI